MEAAVRKYQADHGLTVDGMAGRRRRLACFDSKKGPPIWRPYR
ncbi:peptidoglycan-binding domain-containing protein [Bianquea renquensis]